MSIETSLDSRNGRASKSINWDCSRRNEARQSFRGEHEHVGREWEAGHYRVAERVRAGSGSGAMGEKDDTPKTKKAVPMVLVMKDAVCSGRLGHESCLL